MGSLAHAAIVLNSYLPFLGLTLAIEVPVVTLFYFQTGRKARATISCIAANLLTHPAMHFLLPGLFPDRADWLLAGELLATIVEAGFIWASTQPEHVGRAMVAAAVANATSFAAGVALF